MSKILLFLPKEYTNAYDLGFKKKYSTPKIYNAKGDVTKRWYVYYSFRNPATDKLERQPGVYAGVNQFDNTKDRTAAIKILREAVQKILENGYSPFENNEALDETKKYNIPEAITFVLELKKSTLAENSYTDLKIRLKSFEKWLLEHGYNNRYVTVISKKTVINYLNTVLASSSPKNRNNARASISSFFGTLYDNEIVGDNFVKKINVLKSEPNRNKTYSTTQEKDIFEYLEQNEPLLLLYIKFISYNHLRPVEVVRLKIKNIDQKDKRLFIKTKNKKYKIKIIPEILLKELGDLSKFDPENWLFTPSGIGQPWETNETDRRGNFGKQFLKVKKLFNLGADYGLYSFRHTFITKLYRELVKGSTPFEAKSKLMLITGHSTMSALEKYLRDIDAELPDDYSEFIK